MATDAPPDAPRVRRPPPPFRRGRVVGVERITPRLARVAVEGPELVGFAVPEPAASVRVLLGSAGDADLALPSWAGNEFLLPDGTRPPIRTLTPCRPRPAAGGLDLEIVLHGDGVASTWAAGAAAGDPVAISGPARGYTVDTAAPAYLLVGDETAVPAIRQLVRAIPEGTRVDAHVEVTSSEARVALGARPNLTVTFHELDPHDPPGTAMLEAVRGAALGDDGRVWAAGEAAGVQRIRKHLFEARGVERANATVRGYWKHGRAATGG